MKRGFAIFLCLCLLALPVITTIPAGAANKPFSTLYYQYDPAAEGETGESGELSGTESSEEDYVQFFRSVTVSCDTSRAKLFVGNEPVDGGSYRLEKAGIYQVKVQNTSSGAAVTHYIEILPDLGFESGHVFAAYPTVSCANSSSMTITKGGKTWDPTLPLTEFGEYQLLIDGNGRSYKCTVCVHYCTSERVSDSATGKEALKVTVGDFPDLVLEAQLDGTALQPGENIITAVGKHTLTAQVNGVEADAALMPAEAELLLQVQLYLDALEAKEPFTLDLTSWDANFYLDGSPVSGLIRVTDDGEHTLNVRHEDGSVMEGMILLGTASDKEYRTVDSVTFTFHNPHRVYAWIAVVPAALLLCVVAYFLVARRRIV